MRTAAGQAGAVTVLADPGDSPQAVAELAGRHDLDHGVAVCQPQPGGDIAQRAGRGPAGRAG